MSFPSIVFLIVNTGVPNSLSDNAQSIVLDVVENIEVEDTISILMFIICVGRTRHSMRLKEVMILKD